MPAPTILKRTLSFHFPRSVTATKQLPQTLEVIIVPLSDPSAPDQGTYVGGLQKQSVLLDDDDNVISFQLVPTASPDLVAPVTYRAAWREGGVLGRTVTHDFAMPDRDVRFDELSELGQIVGGETYLQQSDLGVPGRVAKLNDDGVPVDINGHPAAGAMALDSLANMLDDEVTARMAGDATSLSQANTFTSAQVNDLEGRITTNLDDAVGTLQTAINNEVTARQNNIASEINARTSADSSLSSRIDTLASSLTSAINTLPDKASLVGGKVPLSQIPSDAISSAVTASNQAAMLALTTDQVQPGDIAVRPDGAFFLNGTDPSVLSNWVSLTKVSSVNGYQGTISLTPADIGAIATGTSLPITQITGLATALADKVSITQLNALSATVSSIQGDDTVVRKINGVIPSNLLDTQVAFVNNLNQVTLKDGTVIASGTGDVYSINGMSGAVTLTAEDIGAIALDAQLPISEITGLQSALDGKVDASDSRMTNSRVPTTHADSHAADGDDAITISVSQVTGLSTTLSGLATSTTTTALGNRVSSLETQIVEIVGTGGGSPVSKDVWWDSAMALTNISTPSGMQTAGVRVKSPFGQAEDGSYYYAPEGANEDEVVWPYITPNGHLQFRRWDESGDPDPIYATQAALDSTDTAVALKATKIDLDALALTVSTKADQLDVTALQSAVSGKASVSSVNALNTQVATLAQQTQVDALSAALQNKASQSDFSALATTVGTKASQADMAVAENTIGALVTAIIGKADLIEGVVALEQIPAGIPQTSIDGLTTTLASKADLVNGKLNTNQIPSIPMGSVTNLNATLATKADLVNGKLATSQLPSLASHDTFAVANRTSMLALTSEQAQLGDQCIITTGADQGTYTLIGADPSQFTNWLLNTVPSSPVMSINGKVGNVVISAADVGAYPSSTSIPIANVAGLSTQLASYATTSSVTDALRVKVSSDEARQLISQTAQIKRAADYVATAPITSMYGLNVTVDGSPTPLTSGTVILVTAQSSPATNGLYRVSTTAWERVSDMPVNSYFIGGSLVVVTKGSINSNTVWQLTSPSGTTGTDANNWSKILQAGPPVSYSPGNGLTIDTNGSFTVQESRYMTGSSTLSGGLTVTKDGVRVDTTVARKFTGTVPAGLAVCPINHRLNTLSPIVQVINNFSNEAVLVGWTVAGPDTVSLEFATPVARSDEWRVVVIG